MDAPNEEMAEENPYEVFINNLIKQTGLTEVDESRVKELRKELADVADRERMSVSRRNLLEWAFLVHDFNRMHIFGDYAREIGMETTPIHGTLIAAGYEQYIRGICSAANRFLGKEELVYAGQTLKFREPTFVKRFKKGRIRWDLESSSIEEGGIDLEARGINNMKKLAVSCINTKLRRTLDRLSEEYLMPFTVSRNILERTSIEVKKGECDSYQACLGKEPVEMDYLFMMHPPAFIIASVLALSSKRTGRPEGTYAKMDFNFHNIPKLGMFETMITMPRDPRKVREGYLYGFRALVVQNEKPIVNGDVVCYSPNEIKID